MSPALSFFSQYPNLHNSYVNCFIDSFNCKRDVSSVLMEYCPESCIWKVKYLCINGTRNSLLIHGFSLVNARLLKAFGTAFYAITLVMRRTTSLPSVALLYVQQNLTLKLRKLRILQSSVYLLHNKLHKKQTTKFSSANFQNKNSYVQAISY